MSKNQVNQSYKNDWKNVPVRGISRVTFVEISADANFDVVSRNGVPVTRVRNPLTGVRNGDHAAVARDENGGLLVQLVVDYILDAAFTFPEIANPGWSDGRIRRNRTIEVRSMAGKSTAKVRIDFVPFRIQGHLVASVRIGVQLPEPDQRWLNQFSNVDLEGGAAHGEEEDDDEADEMHLSGFILDQVDL